MSNYIPFTSVGPLPRISRGGLAPRDSATAALGPAAGPAANAPWDSVAGQATNEAHGYEPTPSPDGMADPRVRNRIAGGCWRGIQGRLPPQP